MNIIEILASNLVVGSIQVTAGDALGFLTGLLCVWLTAKASIWNFAWGMVNSLILGLVFLDQRLFADSALQVVFIALSIQGWWQWKVRGNPQASRFRATTWHEQAILLAVASIMAWLMWLILVELRGSAPPLDALITALSLCAQWQLNRRQVSSWYWWIAVDLISVPIYWSRGLYLIACLYVVFLALRDFQHGLVIGKFYPPHLGHEYLIRTAAVHSQTVTVVVMGASTEKLSIAQRVQWLRNAFWDHHNVRIVGEIDDVPVDYQDEGIWQAHVEIMRKGIRQAAERWNPQPPVDAVFTSEPYGDRLAKYFECPHVCLDKARSLYPTSGTAVRANVAGQWHMLSPAVQAGMALRVVVLGAESTGTTTLSRELTDALHQRGGIWSRTQWVAEYGREYSANLLALTRSNDLQATASDIAWESTDFVQVAQMQCRLENTAAARGGPVLICDTDAFATRIWHERYMSAGNAAVDEIAANMPPRALYILTSDLGVPFEDDGLRDGEHLRSWMTQRFRTALVAQTVPWIEVHGSPKSRCTDALHALDQLIAQQWAF
eukprot:gene22158-27117_t